MRKTGHEANTEQESLHDNDSMRSAVVAARDRTEPLLTRRIPDLQLDRLAVQLDGSDFKVNTNGTDVALRVGVVGEAQQKARLADARVPNEQQLEEVVILCVHD